MYTGNDRNPKKLNLALSLIVSFTILILPSAFGVKDNSSNEKSERIESLQRMTVDVDEGSIRNGTPCYEGVKDSKLSVFYCDNGTITLEYVAPEGNKATFDHIVVYNGCATKDETYEPRHWVDQQEIIGKADIVLIHEGYSGTITVSKNWDYSEGSGKSSTKYVGSQTVSFSGTFKPIPQMEGMEGQPITIFGPDKVSGTWKHNEDRYCSGDCDCSGLDYQEFGSGDFPQQSLQGLILITNLFPTDNKVVADQLGQFGLVNWYDIATPTENVPTETRSRYYVKDVGCLWDNSTSTTNLTGAAARFKIKDINHLQDRVSWSSSRETTSVSITDMTEAIYEQKPFDPEKDGTEYTYTVTWNLKAL